MAEPHVISALNDKHAEFQSHIQAAELSLAQLRDDLAAVTRVLRLFDLDINLRTIAPRGPVQLSQWFGPGECARLVSDILRPASKPVPTKDIIDQIMGAKGLYPAEPAPAFRRRSSPP